MTKIIKFPPKIDCHACGVPLRPATRAEINIDLQSKEYEDIAQLAAQGDADWIPGHEISEWIMSDFTPSSWLLRCSICNARVLWSSEEG